MVRNKLGVTPAQWDGLPDAKKEDLVAAELWVPSNIKVFLREERLKRENKHRMGKVRSVFVFVFRPARSARSEGGVFFLRFFLCVFVFAFAPAGRPGPCPS